MLRVESEHMGVIGVPQNGKTSKIFEKTAKKKKKPMSNGRRFSKRQRAVSWKSVFWGGKNGKGVGGGNEKTKQNRTKKRCSST